MIENITKEILGRTIKASLYSSLHSKITVKTYNSAPYSVFRSSIHSILIDNLIHPLRQSLAYQLED